MTSYEHKVKNIYLGSPYEEGTPIIAGDYTLLRGPCDEGFHVPLIEERRAIVNAGRTDVTVKTNLHIPFTAGVRGITGQWTTNAGCNLWSSSPNGLKTYGFSVGPNGWSEEIGNRVFGCSVRGFRNTPIIPDETRTETVTGKVWDNSDLGLISVLVGTNKYVTLQDKNVGATEVYNGTLTENNRGKFYQRGNNYGFTWDSSGDTSSTRVDASGYGPNNPYNSSTFITTSSSIYDRSSVQNDNLRGYTDFNS